MSIVYIIIALLENILAVFIKNFKRLLPYDIVIPALETSSKEYSHLKEKPVYSDVQFIHLVNVF